MPGKLDLIMGEDAPLSLTTLFDYNKVHHNSESEVVGMLRITAPDQEESTRIPLHLVACVDISTSMHGAKIRNAIDSLKKLIENLGPDDRLTILSFSGSATTVFKGSFMNGAAKSAALTAVSHLRPYGATNIGDALSESLAALKADEGRSGALNRVIIFTDGDPTVGITDDADLLDLLHRGLTDNLSLTAFGYGRDVKVELLRTMSSRARGSYYYIEDIEKCAAAFGIELGGLLTVSGQNLEVSIDTAPGVEFLEFLDTAYSQDGQTITMPDILAGESKCVLFRMKLPKKSRSACARPSRVYTVRLDWTDRSTSSKYSVTANGRIDFVRRQDEVTSTPHPEVQEQVDLHEASKALRDAKRAADMGNFDHAQNILWTASAGLGTRTHQYADDLRADLASIACSLTADSYGTAVSNRLETNSHTYATRRASGTQLDNLFLTETQASTRRIFNSDTPETPSE